MRNKVPRQTDWIFYDGHCALCHSGVLFAVKRDPQGKLFRFAPLQGKRLRAEVPLERRRGLPDSFVVWTGDKKLLLKSDAVVYLLKKIGGFWGGVGFLLGLLPKPLRNGGYDAVAKVRKKVFGVKEGLCPVMPLEWRKRFDLS